MHLRTLLAIAFGTIALVVALCGAFGARVLTSRSLERQIGAEMATAAGQVRKALDGSVYNRWREINILASVAETTARTPDDRRVWIESMRRTFPAYAWIGFADPDGTVTASTGRMLEGASVAARPWFQAAREHPYAGDLHEAALLSSKLPAPPDGAPWRFVDVAAPVRDAAGKLEGVVGAHLSWTWARDLTANAFVPVQDNNAGSDVLVIDEAGKVILGPPDLQDKAMPDVSTAWRTARDRDIYALETWPDGKTYLVAASRTRGANEYPGLGWTVLIREDATLAFAPAFDLSRQLLFGGLLLSTLAALLGWATAWWISRPVLALANTAELLGRVPGIHAPTVKGAGIQEVRRLAVALGEMFEAVTARDRSLAEANQRLEQRVEARTQELQSARLAAESASRAKTRFLAGMSHELRTPLNGILGYATLLQEEGGLDERQLQRTDAMVAAGQHLLEMINRVLDLSEIEAEHVDLRLTAVAIKPLARECLDMVRPTAQAKALKIEFDMAADAPQHVMADRTRLRQILVNLLGNAVKFTGAGTVSLHLLPAASHGTLRIEVADTGPGVPPARRHRLFHDFDRLGVEAGTTEGAGLGLALSSRLAVMMGAKLGYEDRVGGGSVFWLELPVASPASVAGPTLGAPVSLPTRPADGQGPALRVLVADDTAMNRDIAATFLSKAGHSVVCAEDGRAAVELAASQTFDAVVMDVRMPGVDGLEATRRIRALPPPHGQVPIVALTAQAFAEQVAECRAAGMDAHLSKPFDQHALVAAVTGAASGRPRPSPPARSGKPILDHSVYDEAAAHFPPETVYVHLATIAEECETVMRGLRSTEPGSMEEGDLAEAAHTLAGTAGLFGFAQLSDVARRYDYAVDTRSTEGPALRGELAQAISATLREIDGLVSLSSYEERTKRELAD